MAQLYKHRYSDGDLVAINRYIEENGLQLKTYIWDTPKAWENAEPEVSDVPSEDVSIALARAYRRIDNLSPNGVLEIKVLAPDLSLDTVWHYEARLDGLAVDFLKICQTARAEHKAQLKAKNQAKKQAKKAQLMTVQSASCTP